MSDRWRLFVAVELPDEPRAAVVRAVETLHAPPGFRPIPDDQLHLTLVFLGAVEPARVAAIEERLVEVAAHAAPFETALTAFGAFPPRGAARVLWVGLCDDEGRLAGLARATDDGLRGLVVTQERPFRAHVTVARARAPVRVPQAVLETAVEPVRFEVGAVTLFRSHLGGRLPARYEPLQRWHLGPETP